MEVLMPEVHTEELILKLIQGYLEAKKNPTNPNPHTQALKLYISIIMLYSVKYVLQKQEFDRKIFR